MAKRELERTVQPSVLDRLTDEDRRSTVDPRVSYLESLRAFKAGVQRDLEWLLNTRRASDLDGEQLEEVRNSLYCFGMPDITSMSADSVDARTHCSSHDSRRYRSPWPRWKGNNGAGSCASWWKPR
jgi:type VI secretion system protein ImpF